MCAKKDIQLCPFFQTEPPSFDHNLHYIRTPESFDVFFAGVKNPSNLFNDLRNSHAASNLGNGAGRGPGGTMGATWARPELPTVTNIDAAFARTRDTDTTAKPVCESTLCGDKRREA